MSGAVSIEAIVSAFGPAVARLLRDPEVVSAVRELLGASAPAPAPSLLSAAELARRVGVSPATIKRLAKEPGAPIRFAGCAMRFDLSEFQAWLATRGRRPTVARRAESDDNIDVTAVARRAGLRALGGGK